MRAVVLVCLVAGLAAAAPKYTRKPIASAHPSIVEAERLWAAAAAERDPAKAPEAWERAAEAFVAIAEAAAVGKPEQQAAATAALLAWKNALNVDPRIKQRGDSDTLDYDKLPSPRPIPPREQKLIHALEVMRRFDTTSDDAISALFLRANILRRYEHLDTAIPMLLEIIDKHPAHETAEYAANLVLDSYNRMQRYDLLVALADKLYANKPFLAKRPDLADMVARIRSIKARRGAEHFEKRAKETGDRTIYDQCAEAYLGLLGDKPNSHGVDRGDDESLYNAMVCFQEAGSVDRALATGARLLKQFPKSKLASRVLGRTAVIRGNIGHIAEAAAAAEQLIALVPNDKDAHGAASDAIAWRIALGELDRAARIADDFSKRATSRDKARALDGQVAVIYAMLAAGKRREAARRLSTIAAASLRFDEPPQALAIAHLLADAACPTTLVDGLCGKPRDPQLAASARGFLRRSHGAPEAMLLVIDLELDATPTGDAANALAKRYRDLADTAKVPAIRAAARARLGVIARRLGAVEGAKLELEACATEASAAFAWTWYRACERELAALKAPLEPRPERLPVAVAPVEPDVER